MDEAGQASRDQAGLQALGSQRQVRRRDKAAERLAERRPRVIPAQLAAQRLRVVHDLILAEVAQVRGLLLVRIQVGERLGVHARRLARASLIEEHHAVILQETIHPPASKRAETRARVARAALQEHSVGRVLVALAHDLARENLNRRIVRACGAQVIKGNVQAVFVNGVTVVQVRLCVHGHNGSGFAAVSLWSFVFGRRWWCCLRPHGCSGRRVWRRWCSGRRVWRRWCSGRRRPRPPARLGVLTSFGAAPRSPPVPSGPSGASTPVTLIVLACCPDPATAHVHRSQAHQSLWRPPHRRLRVAVRG